MTVERWLRALLLGIVIWATIMTFAKADVYMLAKYTPIGSVSWQHNGGQDWMYQKNAVQVGLGWGNKFSEDITLSTRQYLVIDGDVGPTGAAGNVALTLGGAITVKYEYNYRWYDGSEVDYGYATGGGIINKVILDIVIPIL